MRPQLFTSNVPVDEKRISHIEHVVTRLARRERKQQSAIITPYPISHCAVGEDVQGEVLRYMFCAKGEIVKGMIQFDIKPKYGIKVGIRLLNDMGATERAYNVTKKSILISPNMTVFSGDKLIISVFPLGDDEEKRDKITEAWLSLLWVPDVKDAEIKNFLVSEVEDGLRGQVIEQVTGGMPASGEAEDA